MSNETTNNTTRGAAAIDRAAALLSVTREQVIAQYRDAAYSLAAWANWNDLEMILFVRACLAVRHPLIVGRSQYDLAVEVLVQEKILDRAI